MLITGCFASQTANYCGLFSKKKKYCYLYSNFYFLCSNLRWHNLDFLTSFLKNVKKYSHFCHPSMTNRHTTEVCLDISDTTKQFRGILTTLKTAVEHPEEVTVDKRWLRSLSSTTEMAMGLITAGFLWCPQ